jgi:SAM-dependent methyltransferase
MTARLRALAHDIFDRLPSHAQARLRRLRVHVRWGSLRRLTPIDGNYGYGRGTPVDRVYIGEFIAGHERDIVGRVLEVKDARYAGSRRDRITRLDILDVNPENLDATIVCDLSDEGSLPAGVFDCVILTQTLQYTRDLDASIANIWQSLRPGGVALITLPATARRDAELAAIDRWRMLPAGLATVLERSCRGAEIHVGSQGNVLAATASLQGIAAEELRANELDAHDETFPIITWARLRKPPEPV